MKQKVSKEKRTQIVNNLLYFSFNEQVAKPWGWGWRPTSSLFLFFFFFFFNFFKWEQISNLKAKSVPAIPTKMMLICVTSGSQLGHQLQIRHVGSTNFSSHFFMDAFLGLMIIRKFRRRKKGGVSIWQWVGSAPKCFTKFIHELFFLK